MHPVNAASVKELYPPVLGLVTPVFGPDSLSIQGVLADDMGDPVPDGNYNLLFKLYRGATSVSQQNHVGVPVAGGVFNIILVGSGGVSLDTVLFPTQY